MVERVRGNKEVVSSKVCDHFLVVVAKNRKGSESEEKKSRSSSLETAIRLDESTLNFECENLITNYVVQILKIEGVRHWLTPKTINF